MARRKRATKRRLKLGAAAPTVDANEHPENYIGWSLVNQAVGTSYGSGGGIIPSLAFNDAIVNTSTIAYNSSGVHLQLGTGTNLRLGRHVFFTRLRVRGRITQASGAICRVVVVRNSLNDDMANITTMTSLGQLFETEIFEIPANGMGTPIGPVDYPIAPSTDYQILYDKNYGAGEGMMIPDACPAGPRVFALDLDIPLNLERFYTQLGTVDRGDWALYIVSTDTTNIKIWANCRISYVNQWNFESIRKGVKNMVDTTSGVVSKVYNHPSFPLVMQLLRQLYGGL